MIIKHRAPRQASQSEWQARLEAIRKAPRVVVLALLIIVVFTAFGYRLWNLQIVEGKQYQVKADEQRLQPEVIPAARGIIYASDGTPLVHNIPSFNVVVFPAYLPDYSVKLPSFTPYTPEDITVTFSPEAEAVLLRLAVLLDMPYTTNDEDGEPGVREIVTQGIQRGYVYRPVVVKKRVERDTALLIASERLTMPGVDIALDSRREYLYGPLVSQVLGYTSPIPGDSAEDYIARGYDPDTDRIGVSGVEAVYEEALRGQKGEQLVEADVQGRVIRVVEKEADPVPGGNVYLTLDLDLQQFAQEALLRGMARANSPRGVALVMRPQTGEVLAMVSLPTYDNNLFAKGISVEDWQRLNADVHRPLLNHAISDQVPPGSVFKVVMATAALQEGVLDAKTRLTCPGTIVLPNRYAERDPAARDQTFYCWIWRQGSHGSLDVVGGLSNSCDIFFYKVGGGFEEDDFEGLGPQRIAQYAELFGLGTPTGVELTAEVGGTVPTPTWKRRTHGENWSTGDTYNESIGQGYLSVTPLQMLNAVNVVANGGTLYRPQIVHHVTDYEGNVIEPFAPEVIRTLSITPTNWSLVQQGMEGAVAYGTAIGAQVEGVRVAGKTGTAQFCDDIKCGTGFAQPEHAWFTAYAPMENPEISIIIFLYDGGEGSQMAVPVAHEILEYYFARDKGEAP
ncbi:MAG: penicillin-binding protein 2 [Anaerolineae bacterium]|nr:penicillin-binding protein 2 [Anaerolineae bacterium]